MAIITEIFNLSELDYSLAFGTLLGFYRDKGFIKHDVDMDLMIYKSNSFINEIEYEQLIKELISKNIKIINRDFENRKIVAKYKGISIDFYLMKYFYEKKVYKFCSRYPKYSLQFPDSINANNKIFPIPKNTVEILEKIYGKNWRIPDKKTYEFRNK